MSASQSRAVKRFALAAIICCAGPTAHAENHPPANALQAVPSSDIVTFRTPDKSAGLGRHLASYTGSGTENGRAGTKRTVETLADLLSAPQANPSVIDEPKGLANESEPDEQRPSYSLRPYIAPESVADLVRTAEPAMDAQAQRSDDRPSKDAGSTRGTPSSLRDDTWSAFPLPSMEILHSGQPVQQDAVNFKTPQRNPTRVDVNGQGMIETVEEKLPLVEDRLAERIRETASEDGFALFALDQLSPPAPDESVLETEIPSLTSAIHVSRLRELAVVSLRDAKGHMQRRATHSARKYALESLHLAIDVEDSSDGGNQHMRDLEAGLAAIRESKDFVGVSGSLSTRSMKRMVAVHETSVLKAAPLSKMSVFEATEAYLQEAHRLLVRSAGDSRIASEALNLLGTIEKQMPERASAHSGAVSLIYHSAAVDVFPLNAGAQQSYGKTLLEQGLVRRSIQSLRKSIAIAPSRSAYQLLLDASRMIGDADTARRCLAALNDPRLPSESLIKRLTPSQFASSYRPAVAAAQSQGSSVAQQQSSNRSRTEAAAEPEKTRLGFRSLFSFGR